jgi:hypothetical protein
VVQFLVYSWDAHEWILFNANKGTSQREDPCLSLKNCTIVLVTLTFDLENQ